MWDAPISGTMKQFDAPDDHVAKGGVEIDVLQVGDLKVKRATYPSGWKFSTHVGYTVSGRLIAQFSDGTRLEFGPGSVFVIPAGHDAWVVGDEPCVIVQFDEGEAAARRFNVAGATAKAG